MVNLQALVNFDMSNSAPEGIRTPIDGTGNHNSIH